MDRVIGTVRDYFYSYSETEKTKVLREGVKAGMHTAKMVATAALLIALATVFFGLYFGFGIGGTLGYFFSVPSLVFGTILGIVSYDGITAAEKGYQLASKADNFAPFDNPSAGNQSALIQHCKGLVDQMVKETYVLKYAQTYVLNRYWESITTLLKMNRPR